MRLVKRQEIYRGREKYIFFPSLYIFPIYLYIYSWMIFKRACIKNGRKMGFWGNGGRKWL
ncbi:MAG: hypothetical protein DRP00_00410 [Candidatus Aenigmatarchaeota archaeon]|nr:MAG: hypothetical protein DRP00_00410 [Candidatus Aenigmarchaeota archaeon]